VHCFAGKPKTTLRSSGVDEVLQKYSTIWVLRHDFAARHIEDALNLKLLNQQRHVEFGNSNRTSSTPELRRVVLGFPFIRR
jgi:hypothetical protein